MRKPALVPALLAIAMVFWAMPARSQELKGAIEGVVKDSSGGILPGVTVQARNIATSVSLSAVSDAGGVYRFPALQPGTYEVNATLSGFNPTKVPGVKLLAGQILKVEVIMAVAGLTEAVTVLAETPLVDIKQNAVTQTITSEVIDLIPKGRNYLAALSGLPGTGVESRGGVTIDGAPGAEHRYVIDGMDTTNLRSGVAARDVVVDFLDTIQVKSSGYNAEYRAATGGVVTAITKSGTNLFHGDIGTYYEGKKIGGLLGDPRPTLRLNPADMTKSEYFTPPRVFETEEWDSVGSIGGPILKNKAWFFVGINYIKEDTLRTVNWTSTTWTGPKTQSFDSHPRDNSFQYNATTQLNKSMRLRFSGSNFRADGNLGLPGINNNQRDVNSDPNSPPKLLDENGNRYSSDNPTLFNPRVTTFTHSYEDTYAATLDWMLNDRMYVNFTTGYYYDGAGTRGGDYYHGLRRTFAQTNIGMAGVPAEFQQVNGYTDNPSNSFNLYDDYSRFFVNADVTRFANWKGRHAIKAGMQIERLANQVNTGAQFPNISLQWNTGRTTLDNRIVRGEFGYYSIVRSYTIGDIDAKNLGFFIQDQWSVSDRLTLNYGVRAEHTHIPSYRPENPSLSFGWGQQIAPRLGFAYDIKGDGKWKAFGSWGVFFDTPKLEMPRGLWGAEHILTFYYTLDTFNWPSISCEPASSGCPGTFIEQVDSRHVANDPENNLIDPNLKPVQTREFTVGLDHEISRVVSVGTRYVHKWFIRTIEDTGVQVAGVGEVFYIANPGYGLGEAPLGPEYPQTPFPKRVYDGIDLTFRKRLSNNWFANANILFSRLWGNYSGLTSTDEGNRNSPNVNRFFDGLYMSYDSKGNAVYGRLQNDRPIQFKLQGGYIMPWGTQVGFNFVAGSGYVNSSTVTYKSVPVFYDARGDLGRSPAISQTDLNFAHTFRLPKNTRATIQFNLDNLFDQDIWTALAVTPYRDNLTLPVICRRSPPGNDTCDGAFFNGFDLATAMAARVDTQGRPSPGRPNDTYDKPSSFQGARTARLSFKFLF